MKSPAPLAPRHDEAALRAAFAERILVIDGAMGTMIQNAGLGSEDFGGPNLEGCNENLVRTRPDLIRGIHAAYYAAGADIVETNTFGSTPLVLDEYGLGADAEDLSRRAAVLAREAAEAAEAATGRPRWVAGALGPTTKTLSVTGGISFEALAENYRVQARGLLAGGVELLLVETALDTSNMKAALVGIRRAFADAGRRAPIALSATIESTGTMLAGQDIESWYVSIERAGAIYVGMNCATGPGAMRDHLRTLAGVARTNTAVVPNAGLPDETLRYNDPPERFVAALAEYARAGWVNLAGGCCGTTPRHIELLCAALAGAAPRKIPSYKRTHVSGITHLVVEPENRPVQVGERTNVLGSRKFKRLIDEGLYEEAAEVGRAQVRAGAQILDVCLQDPDRDERRDMKAFLERLVKVVKVPLMIDSTDPQVFALALPYCQGKAILNSINLEDGEKRFAEVAPLAREYGAAVVVGCIDEAGQTRDPAKKLAIALRSHDLLTKKYGIPEEDILFDPLVFPVASGDVNYIGAGADTIEGIRRIAAALPACKTCIGLSNVSFGLPPAGREVLNSVFLHRCVEAGLDMALVNAEALERYASIPPEEKALCDALIDLAPGDEAASKPAIDAFAAHFRNKSGRSKRTVDRSHLSLDERLAVYIVEGTKEGLVADLEAKRAAGAQPLEIINGPLLAGMAEVGRLFGSNQLIVAEVLQSAEVMKAAVSHLEQFMAQTDSASKGKVVLATVKGDVHDIGKNLVEIILSNNGWRVVNLGIKVPPEAIINSVREENPDVVGLSGLLVKSAQMMVTTAEDMARVGITTPILVGGAALTAKFTEGKIAPAYGAGIVRYAGTAMEGLALADQVQKGTFAAAAPRADSSAPAPRPARRATTATTRAASVPPLAAAEIPRPPDLKRHVVQGDLDEIARWINPQMLYSKHLGLKGSARKLLAAGDAKAKELAALVRDLTAWGARGGMKCRAVWRFFRARAEGNRLLLPETDVAFDFPRQGEGEGLCLADYVSPTHEDFVAVFVTTAGPGIREEAERLKTGGEFLRSIALQSFAIETAEAYAELLHAEIRRMWGFPDPADADMEHRFKARYRGVRVSPGYPACPDLDDQAKLFRLLDPAEIGVELTEGMMMDPEASVSAVVFHHPAAKYFSVE